MFLPFFPLHHHLVRAFPSQCCSKDMKFPKLAEMTKELWLLSINLHISSLLEVSWGMMNMFCKLLRPKEFAHPSGFIQPESSMGMSELPKFATALSKALHLPKLVAIKAVKGYLFSPRGWHRAKPHPIQSSGPNTREKNKGKRQLWQYFIFLSKTICLQGWAPKGSSLGTLAMLLDAL